MQNYENNNYAMKNLPLTLEGIFSDVPGFFLMHVVVAKVGQGISLSISEVGPAAMGDAFDTFLDLEGQISANKPSIQAVFYEFTMVMATRTQKIDL